uniref:hypothetical protein n=1 Tax=Herbidospora sakaeratensis TaxID=564415 RepID=UPI000A8D5722|nr:hypothetical protein [Herbidospora sakaeratensis]
MRKADVHLPWGSQRVSMDVTARPGSSGSADTTELHRYAEALLVHLTADGGPPPPPPGAIDVPGYWLSPAVRALALILSGDDAMEPLSEAAQLDGAKTALFLCLALAVCGHGDRIHASWLGTAFGDLSSEHPVTAGQRALWLAAARGAYGPAGKIFVLRKLDAVEVLHDDDVWLKALVPAEPGLVVPPSLNDFPELAQIPELGCPVQAATRLARLRHRCEEITSVPPPTGALSKTRAVWPDTEPMAVLSALVGSPEPEGPLSALNGHLLDDLKPGADPYLAALALHVAAPAISTAAAHLADRTDAEQPETLVLPILGHSITLRPDGPDAEAMADAERRIMAGYIPRRPSPMPGYLAALGGLVVFTLGFVLSMILAVVGVGIGALGAWLLWRFRGREKADLALVNAQVAELHELATSAVWALHEYAREAKTRRDQAISDVAEVGRLLKRGPRAG